MGVPFHHQHRILRFPSAQRLQHLRYFCPSRSRTGPLLHSFLRGAIDNGGLQSDQLPKITSSDVG